MANLGCLSTRSRSDRRADRDPGIDSGRRRRRLRIASAAIAAALLAGCNTNTENLINNGIGASLYTADLARETDLLEQYSGYICVQASLPTLSGLGSPRCDYPSMTKASWTDFLIQGMNDIDRRCDSYLLWLDARRRNSGALQNQISDTAAATAAIMGVSGATAKAISIVGIAFGLLRNSVENYTSRLLLEIDGSTVSTIVLTNRNSFRNDRNIYQAASKPEVLYVLRGYLRLCLPFAIEREINAFATQGVLGISGRAATSPLAAANVVSTATARQVIGPVQGGTERQFTARERIVRDVVIEEPDWIPGAVTTWERQLQNPDLEKIQKYLCIATPARNFGNQTRAGIVVFNSMYFPNISQGRDRLNEASGAEILQKAQDPGPCDAFEFSNPLERRDFASEANVNKLIRKVNAKLELTGEDALPEDGDLNNAELRNAIRHIYSQERLEPDFPELHDEVTNVLLGVIEFDFP